ncbi:4-aminobutyrate--2-oxoglutarate transaminase, partial [Micrococcus luteus]|uniref:4-aminobutyrate--2-oxoglutarate transaminase n=2 Tax=Bacillati TaxID=1783272 RepID=UPI00365F21A2
MTATPDLEQTRHLVTELPGPRSRELAERQKRAVPAGVATTMPVYAARAAGGILEDVDGNRLIDLASGIAVTSVGASHPRVVAAVQEQVAQFTHTSFMITPYEGYVAVAEQLDRTSPIPGETRTALFNSGAEAVENAVKVARAYTGKQAVAAFDHAYHGRTTLTMALTAKSMPYKHSFGPFAPEIYRVPGSYPLRDGLSGAEAAQRAISALEKQIGADNLAAVIMEPIQGEGGFIVPAEGFLPAVVEWCKANDVLFIADEVQSGIARTGAWFASETEGIEPDLMATAKGIAGGMPLSGVTGRAEVMDSVHPGGLGGTYGGNPVATAAALAVFEAVEEDGLLEKARRIEQVIREHFAQNADDRIAEVRGRGAMMAIEFVDPATGEPDATLTATVAAAVRAAGVILLTCGTYGNVVRFLPPLTIGEDLLKEGLSEVTKALQSGPNGSWRTGSEHAARGLAVAAGSGSEVEVR